MIRLTTKIPIFRRLFFTFFLAALMVNGSMLGMSLLYLGVLRAHGMPQSETSPFLFWTILAMIAATALLTVLGYAMNLTITQPLTELAAFTRSVREGQTDARIPVFGDDEIAAVALAMNQMLDHIASLVRRTQEQHAVLQREAEHLIDQVSKVGQGDLTIQAEVGAESIAVLADFFNFIIEELSNLVGRVRQVAMSVEQSTLTTQREMVLLVTTSTHQRSFIEDTARTIESMAEAFLQVVERAKHLNQAAGHARQSAQQGRETVQQIWSNVAHISRKTQESARLIQLLEGRSQEVGDVVELLDSLAHQTNKLALDAAIQVAMTGDAGANQGFRAIADEIRRLSERAKMEITAVSQKMQGMRADMETVSGAVASAAKEVATGTARVQEAGQFFETIFGLVEQQAGESTRIATMMERLYASAFGMVETMQAVSESTQQNSARTSHVAQEMQQLAMLAQQLRLSVEVFQLKDQPAAQADEEKEALRLW
jgi:methyl-accepting chemotaxis protein